MSNKEPTMDPRVLRTLQVIREALIDYIAEQGFDRTTVRDITARAMINRATFYLHYQDKYDLLQKTVDGMMAELESAMQLPPNVTIEQLNLEIDVPPHSFVRQFEHLAANARFYKVMLGSNGIPGFADRMEQVIRSALIERLLLAQPDEFKLALPRELIIHYATSAHVGMMKHWLQKDMPFTPVYMATQLKRLHLLGPTLVTSVE